MFGIIQAIIDHTYQTNYSGDQQYIYYICGALIIMIMFFFFDTVRNILRMCIKFR